LRSVAFIVFPILAGLMTLFFFNRQQYLAQAGSDVARIAPPAVVIGFNLTVILAYAVFAGILVWLRRRRSAS